MENLEVGAEPLSERRPLRAIQRNFVAAQLQDPQSPALNMPVLVRFPGPIELGRLSDAFEAVVTSSDALRTVIAADDPEHALVLASAPKPTTIREISIDELDDHVAVEIAQPFDLSTGLYRSSLLRHEDGSASWLLTIHHLATDATSHTSVVEAALSVYTAQAPPSQSFYDWAEQQREALPAARAAHWADQATDAPREIRTERDTTATRVEVDAVPWRRIDEALGADYRLLTPDLSRTAFMTLATAIYLARSGGERVRLALPVHHRDETSNDLIGPTLNMYPLDIAIDRDATVKELHSAISRQLIDVIRHSHPGANPTGSYDAIVNVVARAARRDVPGIDYRLHWLHAGHLPPNEALRVHVTAYDGSADDVGVYLDVLTGEGTSGDPRPEADRFAVILDQIIDDPQIRVGDVATITADERATTVAHERGPARPESLAPVASLLRNALASNDAVVLVDGERRFTGRDLWRHVVNLAAHIDDQHPQHARIAVELERSAEAIIAIYAITLAGRSFVPIDPSQPERRRRELREWANVAGVLSDEAQLADDSGVDRPGVDLTAFAAPDVPASAEAYVLFTSGSTGTPKGVPITQHGLASYINFATTHYFQPDETPVAPLYTALTFDLTITTIFAPLIQGGALHVVRPSGLAGLVEVAANDQLTWCKATPSHLASLLRLPSAALNFRDLVVGGESFTTALARDLVDRLPQARIYNEYGPTEAVVGCMFHQLALKELDTSEAVSIGVPAPGVELRVVDVGLQRTAPGVPGELLISHDGLTAGYLDGREPERFVTLDGTRFYRSGDVVVRGTDGLLTYLGRVDDEVKLGGVRLNPVEVELALGEHPAIEQAFVRVWSPPPDEPTHRCTICGLPDNVPGVHYDDAGVCDRCHAYQRIAPAANEWFKHESDLAALVPTLRERRSGTYDCVFLLSGGKDSTFGLYKLVELGFEPLVITYDNGFISEAALENARAATEDLGVPLETVRTDATNAILRDSLATFSNVCNGCYKTIYTLAINRAEELGIPAIVTGLSRGQLFETRLAPSQFVDGRFDEDAIARAVTEARRRYHRAADVPNQLLPTAVFDDDALFDRLDFIDIYRYLDIELREVLDFLETQTPWQRPPDTGRSSNCLVNVVGIRTHQIEQGFHNYAEPYAWDVRLGHKTRDEAIAELDDPIDDDEIAQMLDTIGYQPRHTQILTAWSVSPAGVRPPTASELRSFLAERLPSFAIPSAFVSVDDLPLNSNGKVAMDRLPAPQRRSRASTGAVIEPESELERSIVELWEGILGIEPLGIDDDFFALGGDSLAAITMVAQLVERTGLSVREEVAFFNTTPRSLAAAVAELGEDLTDAEAGPQDGPARGEHVDPPLSPGEQALMWDQRSRPTEVMYNVARLYCTTARVDVSRLHTAIETAASRHEPWIWTYSLPRRPLSPPDAVAIEVLDPTPVGTSDASDAVWLDRQRTPFDLDNGPLLRATIRPHADGTVDVLFVSHHISCDHASLDVLWEDVDSSYRGQPLAELPYRYSDLHLWQASQFDDHQEHWRSVAADWVGEPTFPALGAPEPDGYISVPSGVESITFATTAGRSPVASAVAAAAIAVSEFFAGDAVNLSLVSSTRTHADAQRLCGYLLNVVPVRIDTDVDDDRTLVDVVEQASVAIGQAMPHRAYPFVRIASDARALGEALPSASVLVSYIDDPPALFDGLPAHQRMLFNGGAVADMTFFLDRSGAEAVVGLEYRGSKISSATAQRLLRQFDQALASLHSSPSR